MRSSRTPPGLGIVVPWLLVLGLVGGLPAQVGVGTPPAEKQPADALEGAPFVTARAWAIGDGDTGEVLHGSHQTDRMPIASTTKIMTALLVFRTAEKEPKLLEEVVEVSRFAGNTIGSSAQLRPGDRIPVGVLLYGLLLPSGNDAANALAEHLGSRFQPPADAKSIPWTPRSIGRSKQWIQFVAEMNREAQRLGLANTRYVNPHGLDAPHHYSCARDLLVLAKAAMEHEGFRERVRTRKFRGTFTTESGSRRIEEWNNTNRLLGIEGYEGVKTGTTSKAGACLVSRAVRGEDRLLVVVLNAAGRGSRYVDTRNLFRWGFLQKVAGGK